MESERWRATEPILIPLCQGESDADAPAMTVAPMSSGWGLATGTQ